ncbi:bifunctional oligoribonuclease/PAP phosphatase NrnA [Lapidilactobacillus mulanensis]|uniref:Bifunctional oligoribonuclease/PAP phosphatase NrnA n=1 Tax=Lapidilactobacillus mulanensis TaxID=2485999 RepID=A0ABW4DLY1_9LACO|nr:bifunctional oligoribonuclease/PAP phosphatase NrnA [Lapidilactobacillus mulanensis]
MNSSLQDIIKKIVASDKIIIHRHANPDPDALGSQSGLAESIKFSFPDKKVKIVGSPVGDLTWINQPEEVADDFYQDALVIVTDTADTPRVSDQRFNTGNYLIKIDHHPNDDAYGDMYYVDTTASSCSEIIVDLVNASNGQLKLNTEAARVLYAGIIGDTGRFLYSDTSQHTFEVAAQLVGHGFSHSDVSQNLNEISLNQAKLQSVVYDKLIFDGNGAAHIVITRQMLADLNVKDDQVNSVVSTPGRLREVLLWSLFVEKEDGTYRVHFRSKGPVINEIAKAHHGGGHPLASGANAADTKEIDQIIAELISAGKAYQDSTN